MLNGDMAHSPSGKPNYTQPTSTINLQNVYLLTDSTLFSNTSKTVCACTTLHILSCTMHINDKNENKPVSSRFAPVSSTICFSFLSFFCFFFFFFYAIVRVAFLFRIHLLLFFYFTVESCDSMCAPFH